MSQSTGRDYRSLVRPRAVPFTIPFEKDRAVVCRPKELAARVRVVELNATHDLLAKLGREQEPAARFEQGIPGRRKPVERLPSRRLLHNSPLRAAT